MAYKNYMDWIPLTSINSATFTGAYQVINSAGTPYPCFSFTIVNDSTVNVFVSNDGITDKDIIPTKSSKIVDIAANNSSTNNINALPAYSKIYVKGSAGVGSVYLVGYYQPQGD